MLPRATRSQSQKNEHRRPRVLVLPVQLAALQTVLKVPSLLDHGPYLRLKISHRFAQHIRTAAAWRAGET